MVVEGRRPASAAQALLEARDLERHIADIASDDADVRRLSRRLDALRREVTAPLDCPACLRYWSHGRAFCPYCGNAVRP